MDLNKILIGDIIKKERKKIGLTQEELASKLGLNNKSSVSQYEKGDAIPSDDIKLKMCKLFNCSLDYLMGADEYKIKTDIKNQCGDELFTICYNKYCTKLQKYISDNNKIKEAISIPLMFFSEPLEVVLSPSEMRDKVIYKMNTFLSSYDSNASNKIKTILFEILNDAHLFLNDKDEEDNATLQQSEKQLKSISDYCNISNLDFVPIIGKIAAGQPILAEEYIEGYLPVDPNIYGMSTSEDLFYLRVSGESMNQKVKNGDYALIHKQDYAENGDIVVAIVNGDDEATLKKYKKLNDQFILLEPMSSDPSIEAITVDLKDTNFKIIGKAIGQFGKF